MNDFLIINSKEHKVSMTSSCYKLSDDWSLITESEYSIYNSKSKIIIVVGDYIGSDKEILNSPIDEIPKLRGNFYALVILENEIKIYSSFLNMLPIYMTTNMSVISSSIVLILEQRTQKFSLDKKYILENLLFNYAFFNRTKYKEIALVPCNGFVNITNEKASICKQNTVVELFDNSNTGAKISANELSDMFIETSKHYFPDDSFDIAFTSGFDGRTLVSCALYYGKQFSTFSFGRIENDDVSIPMKNASELGIPYEHFDLSAENYSKQDFIENANEYGSSGYLGNGFLYSHFLYSAKKIKTRSNYLLSGACGSELFRALHNAGAVTSLALVDVFKTENNIELRQKLLNSKALQVLNSDEFTQELDELIDEIIDYKEQLPKNISINQKFYVFVFEEIFRKFFGQWIVVQQKHVKVRTPFLDFKFFQKLLESNFAGANNDFFTSNPFKRVKGQYIYADIIKKTNKIIYRQSTGKGYRPLDVRNGFYMANVILPFIKKKLVKKVAKTYLDNLGIVTGVKENESSLKATISSSTLFNKKVLYKMLKELAPYTPENERDTLLMSINLISDIKVKSKEKELVKI